jgi:hypothetical protein
MSTGINFKLTHYPQSIPFIEVSRYMLPEDEQIFSAALLAPFRSTAVMRAQAHMSKVVLFGHIEFTDIFDVRHYVDFCEVYYVDYFNSAEYEDCPQHNGEEANPSLISKFFGSW